MLASSCIRRIMKDKRGTLSLPRQHTHRHTHVYTNIQNDNQAHFRLKRPAPFFLPFLLFLSFSLSLLSSVLCARSTYLAHLRRESQRPVVGGYSTHPSGSRPSPSRKHHQIPRERWGRCCLQPRCPTYNSTKHFLCLFSRTCPHSIAGRNGCQASGRHSGCKQRTHCTVPPASSGGTHSGCYGIDRFHCKD